MNAKCNSNNCCLCRIGSNLCGGLLLYKIFTKTRVICSFITLINILFADRSYEHFWISSLKTFSTPKCMKLSISSRTRLPSPLPPCYTTNQIKSVLSEIWQICVWAVKQIWSTRKIAIATLNSLYAAHMPLTHPMWDGLAANSGVHQKSIQALAVEQYFILQSSALSWTIFEHVCSHTNAKKDTKGIFNWKVSVKCSKWFSSLEQTIFMRPGL